MLIHLTPVTRKKIYNLLNVTLPKRPLFISFNLIDELNVENHWARVRRESWPGSVTLKRNLCVSIYEISRIAKLFLILYFIFFPLLLLMRDVKLCLIEFHKLYDFIPLHLSVLSSVLQLNTNPIRYEIDGDSYFNCKLTSTITCAHIKQEKKKQQSCEVNLILRNSLGAEFTK